MAVCSHGGWGAALITTDMRYEYSTMTGKRKALLIGINYVGSSSALRGCWNDVHNMAEFIQSMCDV